MSEAFADFSDLPPLLFDTVDDANGYTTSSRLSGMRRASLTCGPMFAGKTTSLISRFRYLSRRYGEHKICVLAPSYDTRHPDGIISHGSEKIPESSIARVKSDHDIIRVLRDAKPRFILVDEVQFFSKPMFSGSVTESIRYYIAHYNATRTDETAREFAEVHYHGLDMDALGVEFPATKCVREMLESGGGVIQKIKAKCHICGADAHMTQRLHPSNSRYAIGGSESYAPVCLEHWTPVA